MQFSVLLSLLIITILVLCKTVSPSTEYVDCVAASYRLGQADDHSVCSFLGERSVYEAFSLDNQHSFADSFEEQFLEFSILNKTVTSGAYITILGSIAAGEYNVWELPSLPTNCSNDTSVRPKLVGTFTETNSSGEFAAPPSNLRSWTRWDITSFYNNKICSGATNFVLGFAGQTAGSAIYMAPTLTSTQSIRKPAIEVDPLETDVGCAVIVAVQSVQSSSTPNTSSSVQISLYLIVATLFISVLLHI